VALFCQVRVLFVPVLELAEEPPLVLPVLLLLHAAIVTTAATAMAMAMGFGEPRMGSHLLMMPDLLIAGLLMGAGLLAVAGSRRTRDTGGSRVGHPLRVRNVAYETLVKFSEFSLS
jgi:hypothetical protein